MIIDKDKAIELMEQAVAEKGEDHVVTKCDYFNPLDGTPVCIVGHVIDRLGKGLDDLRTSPENPVTGRGSDVNSTIFVSLEVDGLEFTPEAQKALQVAQEVQDGQRESVESNWGTAVRFAKGTLA